MFSYAALNVVQQTTQNVKEKPKKFTLTLI